MIRITRYLSTGHTLDIKYVDGPIIGKQSLIHVEPLTTLWQDYQCLAVLNLDEGRTEIEWVEKGY